MSFDIGRVGDLEIDEDLELQRRTWKLQRYFWAGMTVLLGLALLGLFGSGPLSHATVGSKGGPLHLEYQRFARYHAPTTLNLQLGPSRGSQARFQLELSHAYLDGVQIERIEPEPERVIAGPDGSTFVFLRNDSHRPTRVGIHLKPQQRGLLKCRLRLVDGPSLAFRQFIYP